MSRDVIGAERKEGTHYCHKLHDFSDNHEVLLILRMVGVSNDSLLNRLDVYLVQNVSEVVYRQLIGLTEVQFLVALLHLHQVAIHRVKYELGYV